MDFHFFAERVAVDAKNLRGMNLVSASPFQNLA